MHKLKSGKNTVKPVEDPYDVGIGTQFSAETNKRDEDEEMMKYIEDQLSKRKSGRVNSNDQLTIVLLMWPINIYHPKRLRC